MKNIIAFASVFLISLNLFAADVRVFNTQTASYMKYDEFIKELPVQGHIVIGEFHNNQDIQDFQAKIIRDKVSLENLAAKFAVHWEFLNYTEQKKVDDEFFKLFNGEINELEFITNTAGKQNLSYAPIAKVVSDLNGEFYGINLPREIKKQVMDNGIGSVDQKYIPSHHYVGGALYKERFTKVMGGHASPDMIKKYFLGQCLTDSVMADQIAKNEHLFLNFTIAGSFHTDFFDGTVVRLKSLTTEPVTTLKVVSEANSTLSDINYYLSSTAEYGYHSDYIIITN